MSTSQPMYPVIESAKNLKRSFSAQPISRTRQQRSTFLYGFDVNSSALKTEHADTLMTFIQYLRDHPDSTVVSIIGRASQTGPEGNNRRLSRDRADRVRYYMIANGVPDARVGPPVFRGSEAPLVNVPGREEEMNRSVELVIEWVDVVVDPGYVPGQGLDWKLDLTVTFALGLGLGGQLQIGTLTNLTTDERRAVSAFILGFDLGESLFVTAAASAGLPVGHDGEFSMPDPPGAVDFDWFDNRFMSLASAGASLIVGGFEQTEVQFHNSEGPPVTTSFANYPIGLTVGIGGIAMAGIFLVDS
jgi:outer membrane protein OmpA-like peptidoglycan-associated protein